MIASATGRESSGLTAFFFAPQMLIGRAAFAPQLLRTPCK